MTAMLDGTVALELGHTRAAAFCARLLADAGAEVITLHDAERQVDLSRSARLYLDAGKDVVTWDEHGDELLLTELLAKVNVLVTDLPAEELERRGLDWAALRARFPRLAYVELSPVAGVGEDRTSNAGELAMQAVSGLMHMVGDPEREPLALPYGLGMLQLGLHGAAGAAAALQATDDGSAEGRHVQISGALVLASYVRIYGAVANYYRVPLLRDGRRTPGSGGRWPFGIFPCQDGWVAMICRSTREWESLLEMMGDPAWSKQERYRDLLAVAIEYPHEIDELVQPWLMSHTRDELLALAQEYAVPVAPLRDVSEVLADPQLRDFRHFFDELTTADGEVLRIPGRPWHSGPRVFTEDATGLVDALRRTGHDLMEA
jgi:crotonobetainyl-CoA:carnitine CoA-transferase CaiB-like acyl-CoA transferase